MPDTHVDNLKVGVSGTPGTGTATIGSAASGCRGFVAGDSLPFLFGYDSLTSFHTTFVYDRRRDAWEWHMDNDSAGVRRPFARVVLLRAR